MRALLLLALAGCFDYSKLSECNGDTAWVCDNFERGAPADAWTAFAPSASVTGTIDTTKAHASSKSLHITATPVASAEYQLQWKDLPQTAGLAAFARAFVFLPAPTTNTFSLFASIDVTMPTTGVRVFVTPTGLTLHNGVNGPDATSTTALPTGRWTCIEWGILEDNAPTGELRLWVDDVQVAMTSGDTMPTNKLGQIGVGVVYQTALMTGDPLELWIDDVILDDHRITCQQ